MASSSTRCRRMSDLPLWKITVTVKDEHEQRCIRMAAQALGISAGGYLHFAGLNMFLSSQTFTQERKTVREIERAERCRRRELDLAFKRNLRVLKARRRQEQQKGGPS